MDHSTLGGPIDTHLVKKYSAHYGTGTFPTMVTNADH